MPDQETGPERCRLVVLVSGAGSNLESILTAAENGRLAHGAVVLVLSSRPDAYALQRARNHQVKGIVISARSFPDEAPFQKAMIEALQAERIDVVCLAGYLRKLGPELIAAYAGRILNIHPGLLPRYGGAGMYGHYVHEAVLKAGDTESGCTVHVVDEEFDHGPILAQVRVPVLQGDTADRLAERVLIEEHRLYPDVIEKFCARLLAERKVSS